MAGDLQPNESRCRVCEAFRRSCPGGQLSTSRGMREHRVRYQLALGVVYEAATRGACARAGEADGRIGPSADADGAPVPERVEARENRADVSQANY